jgi:hypothetical protein
MAALSGIELPFLSDCQKSLQLTQELCDAIASPCREPVCGQFGTEREGERVRA